MRVGRKSLYLWKCLLPGEVSAGNENSTDRNLYIKDDGGVVCWHYQLERYLSFHCWESESGMKKQYLPIWKKKYSQMVFIFIDVVWQYRRNIWDADSTVQEKKSLYKHSFEIKTEA